MAEAKSVIPRTDLLHVLQDGKIAECFRRAEAAEYIGVMTVRTETGIDIVATARNIGVGIIYDSQMPNDGRYAPRNVAKAGSAGRIYLRPKRPNEQHTFGHEVGHHFLDEELMIGGHLVGTVHEPISEAFCEFFGMYMVAPESDIATLERDAREACDIPDDYDGYVMQRLLLGQ